MNKPLILISLIIAGLLLYTSIQLINSRHALVEQQVISNQQIELINVQDVYIKILEETIKDLKTALIRKESATVDITAYCETQNKTAIGKRPEPGTCAISRNLILVFPMNSQIYAEGLGVFTVTNINDVMDKKWTNRIDLFMDCKAAKVFGIHYNVRVTRIME